jgi:hypothetical protein
MDAVRSAVPDLAPMRLEIGEHRVRDAVVRVFERGPEHTGRVAHSAPTGCFGCAATPSPHIDTEPHVRVRTARVET